MPKQKMSENAQGSADPDHKQSIEGQRDQGNTYALKHSIQSIMVQVLVHMQKHIQSGDAETFG